MSIEQLCFINYIFFGICVASHVIEKEGKFEDIRPLLLCIMFWPLYLIHLEYIK